MPYRLNHNFGGKDTLHIEHSFEECNLDDADKVEMIDDETADALLALDAIKLCEHCHPLSKDA